MMEHFMKFKTYQELLVVISLAINIYFSIFVFVSLSKVLCHPASPCFWRDVKKISAALPEMRNTINYLKISSFLFSLSGPTTEVARQTFLFMPF